jgi:ferric-dicitrate binding protein FerR (iron transport regulator)
MEEEYLLKKWLSGDLTEEETEQFQSLDNYARYKAITDDAAFFKASSFSAVEDYSALKGRISGRKSEPGRGFLYWSSRIAAVLVLGFALYFTFFSNRTTTLRTGVGEKNLIDLPDASVVILNAASTLEYAPKGWEDKRTLELHGEAFFDVVKGSTFTVITPEGSITVLGTEFNVKQRNKHFEVTCFEGRVRVVSSGITKILEAGDKIRLSNGEMAYLRISESGPTWTENLSTFDEVPFSEVLKELERQYQVTVVCDDKDIQQALFTGGFSHDSLEDAIRSVAEPLNLSYRITEQNAVILNPRE